MKGVVKNDLAVYDRHGSDWWDPESRWYRSLRSINRTRLALIEAWLGGAGSEGGQEGDRLRGATVVDLGCGGGLLAEPLARRGARVVGCDLSRASLAAGRRHAEGGSSDGGERLPVAYVAADLFRAPLRDRSADLVLLADTIEHLRDPRAALAEAARLLKAGGHLYVNTIARTRRAKLLAVTIAEGLRLVAPGTHDPALFLKPGELVEMARPFGFEPVHIVSERVRPLRTLLTWTIHVTIGHARWWRIGVLYSALFQAREIGST